MNYYVSVGGKKSGPYTRKQLSSMWNSGAITADALYHTQGMVEWQRVSELMSEEDAPTGATPEPEPRKTSQAPASEPAKPLFERYFGAASTLSRQQKMAAGGIAAAVLIGFVLLLSSSPSAKKQVSAAPAQPAAAEVEETPAPAPVYRQVETRPVSGQLLIRTPPPNTYPEELRKSLVKDNQEYLSAHKQEIFNDFHPTGKATGLKVNDVVVKWANGYSGREWSDVKSYAIRFVLYWQGPLQEGYSEIEYVYDTAIERLTSSRCLRTSGVTREDVGNAAGELAVEMLKQLADKSR